MNSEIENIVNQLMVELKSKYSDFKGIFVFGSRVKDNYIEDSDLDLAIIFDRKIDWRFDEEVSGIAYCYELENDMIFDVHVFNQIDIYEPITPLRVNIKKEGRFYGI